MSDTMLACLRGPGALADVVIVIATSVFIGGIVATVQEDRLRELGAERSTGVQVRAGLGWMLFVALLLAGGYQLAYGVIC